MKDPAAKFCDFITTPELVGQEFRDKNHHRHRILARLIDGDAAKLNGWELGSR